jgi:hypothetical protein
MITSLLLYGLLGGEVMYYSGAAREYYETGVDRKGLFR